MQETWEVLTASGPKIMCIRLSIFRSLLVIECPILPLCPRLAFPTPPTMASAWQAAD
jgi:hypothetical protein